MTKQSKHERESSNAEVVTCTGAHAGVLSALHGASFDEAWSAPSFKELLEMAGVFGLVVLIGDNPLGFILTRQAQDEGEIITLGVDPDHRRQGLARLLVRAAESKLVNAGGRAMFLEVAENNQTARALYEALGYQEVGRREGYYRIRDRSIDALILKVTLSTDPLP